MATYNGEKYIKQQIDSILSQTYKDFELIICDDCSTDKTFEIVKVYSNKYKNIKIFQNNQNFGFKKNFEKLVSLCNGDYIAFSDQDDIWTENHLELLLDIIGNNKVACANSSLIDDTGNSLNATMKEVLDFSFIPETSYKQLPYFIHGNFVQGSAMLIETAFAKAYLPIPEFFNYHDWYYALLSNAIGYPVVYSETSILLYRQHQNSITTNSKRSFIKKFFEIGDKEEAKNRNFEEQKRLQRCDFILDLISDYKLREIAEDARKYYDYSQNHRYLKRHFYFKNHFNDFVLTNNKSKKRMRIFKDLCGSITKILHISPR